MKMRTKELAPELLRELLTFDADTCRYFWNARPAETFATKKAGLTWNRRFAGKETMKSNNGAGYFTICILGHTYKVHHVVWAFHKGVWPVRDIDHIDGDKTNNRMENLRLVTPAENARNQARRKNNTSGCNGVNWHRRDKVWTARIRHNFRFIHLGSFKNLDDAVSARQAANAKYGFHSNHGREA